MISLTFLCDSLGGFSSSFKVYTAHTDRIFCSCIILARVFNVLDTLTIVKEEGSIQEFLFFFSKFLFLEEFLIFFFWDHSGIFNAFLFVLSHL